jgi:hypothetical protein
MQAWRLIVTQTNNILGDSTKYVADIWTFVTRFANSACSLSTPHLYISALPFCPDVLTWTKGLKGMALAAVQL